MRRRLSNRLSCGRRVEWQNILASQLRKDRSDRWSDVDEIMIRSGWQPVSRRYIAAGGGRGRVHAAIIPSAIQRTFHPCV